MKSFSDGMMFVEFTTYIIIAIFAFPIIGLIILFSPILIAIGVILAILIGIWMIVMLIKDRLKNKKQ